jgi:hypothetical protein
MLGGGSGGGLKLLRRGGGAESGKVKNYLTRCVFPTLVPGLVELIKSIEAKSGQVELPNPSDPFEVQSIPLRVYLARNVAPVLNDSLEECYTKKPDDPIDYLVGVL